MACEKNGQVLQIDQSEIIEPDENSQHLIECTLPELARRIFGLMDISCLKVRPTLKSLFVCGEGVSVKFSPNSDPSETFPTFSLRCFFLVTVLIFQQILEGGTVGGRVKVRHKAEKNLFDVAEESSRFFTWQPSTPTASTNLKR